MYLCPAPVSAPWSYWWSPTSCKCLLCRGRASLCSWWASPPQGAQFARHWSIETPQHQTASKTTLGRTELKRIENPLCITKVLEELNKRSLKTLIYRFIQVYMVRRRRSYLLAAFGCHLGTTLPVTGIPAHYTGHRHLSDPHRTT